MKIIFVRKEDYWVFPLSVVGVAGIILMLYAGVMQIRLIGGALGFSILYFMLYIIRKNYGRRLAARYLLINLTTAIIISLVIFILTN